jgi:UDP-glucuronate 4-epimerase
LFTDAILQGRPIKLFNHGQMRRDFTYIDDVVEAVVRLLRRPPKANPKWSGDAPDPATSRAPWLTSLFALVSLVQSAITAV